MRLQGCACPSRAGPTGSLSSPPCPALSLRLWCPGPSRQLIPPAALPLTMAPDLTTGRSPQPRDAGGRSMRRSPWSQLGDLQSQALWTRDTGASVDGPVLSDARGPQGLRCCLGETHRTSVTPGEWAGTRAQAVDAGHCQKAYVTQTCPDATVKSSLPAGAVDVMCKKASAGNAQILKKASLQPV